MIKCILHEEKIKKTFDKRVKEEKFQLENLVLKWDAPKEENHGKFDHMWVGPYIIATYKGDNAFILNHLDGSQLVGGPVNGRYLKHYLS